MGIVRASQGSVTITASARLHLGLISMHSSGLRKNGGVGFSIEAPSVTVEVSPSSDLIIKDERSQGLVESELNLLTEAVAQTLREVRSDPAEVVISGSMLTHVGVGSKTAIQLSIIEAISVLRGLSLSRAQLIGLSGRGGTSGVGISSYFTGGLILDLGHLNDRLPFTPSSQGRASNSPTALPMLTMPSWPLCICVPLDIRPKTQEEEIEFFSRTTPLAASDSYRACYEAVFGIYGSVKDGNYAAFCEAIDLMQDTTWKRLESREYGAPLQRLKSEVQRLGVDCVGMSSLGPALFCFASPSVLESLVQAQASLNCRVFCTQPNNSGRVLSRASL